MKITDVITQENII